MIHRQSRTQLQSFSSSRTSTRLGEITCDRDDIGISIEKCTSDHEQTDQDHDDLDKYIIEYSPMIEITQSQEMPTTESHRSEQSLGDRDGKVFAKGDSECFRERMIGDIRDDHPMSYRIEEDITDDKKHDQSDDSSERHTTCSLKYSSNILQERSFEIRYIDVFLQDDIKCITKPPKRG